LTPEELADVDRLLKVVTERLAAIQSSASAEGGTRVNSGTPPKTTARAAGGGPA
jgi:hypothetical protein